MITPIKSHPAWVRELKRGEIVFLEWFKLSHPAWVRELKLAKEVYGIKEVIVAPCMGA